MYELRDGKLASLREFRTDPAKPLDLLIRLDSAVALDAEIIPTAEAIKAELGRDSPAYRRVEADFASLWTACEHEPDVTLKRQLWRQLLACLSIMCLAFRRPSQIGCVSFGFSPKLRPPCGRYLRPCSRGTQKIAQSNRTAPKSVEVTF